MRVSWTESRKTNYEATKLVMQLVFSEEFIAICNVVYAIRVIDLNDVTFLF